MEALRRQLESADLVPLGRKKEKAKSRIKTFEDSDIIDISSTESSPAFHSARQSSFEANEQPSQTKLKPIDLDVDEDSDEDIVAPKNKNKPVRLIWSDDDDDQVTDRPQARPLHPIKPVAKALAVEKDHSIKPVHATLSKGGLNTAATDRAAPAPTASAAGDFYEKPLPAIFTKASQPAAPRKHESEEAGPYTFKNAPTAIRPPSNPPRDPFPQYRNVGQPSGGPLWETFDTPDVENLHDPVKSAAEAEKDLQELLAGSMNDNNAPIDMEDAVVKGFQEDFTLLPHQIVGRHWMKEREKGKKYGGILADDMGLGKTIQTLTRICDGRPKKADKLSEFCATTLVVCPVALISQWAKEIDRIAIGLRVLEHHGPSRTKKPAELKAYHIVVTSYSVLASEHATFMQRAKDEREAKMKTKKGKISDSDDEDTDDSAPPFGRTVAKRTTSANPDGKKVMDALFHVKWWRIVLDEAHNIKNRATKSAQACCALEGKYRWCLTGTPLQNSVEELYSLLKFLRIRPLNDWEIFNNKINIPVKKGKSQAAMKRLHVVLQAIMLRRKKDTIIDGKPLIVLPPRNVDIISCEFDDEEREFYESISAKVEDTLQKLSDEGLVEKSYTYVLVLLLRLRQACNHSSLVSKDYLNDTEAVEPRAAKDGNLDDADDLADAFGQMVMSSVRRCQMCQASLSSRNSAADAIHCDDCAVLAAKSRRKSLAAGGNLPEHSAKTRKILEILREIRDRKDDEKTIIFSQFTTMLDIIQPFLRAEGFKYVRYDGKMKKNEREKSLDAIRLDKTVKIILISFKAGSTGLNLTSCNNVILVDLWWNPALEDQAFDRAHRFGQTRTVNIYKLTIEDTVETRILELQEKKRELANAALSGDKLKNSRLALNDLMALFKHGADDDEDQ